MERGVQAIRTAVSPTLKIAVDHCVIVLLVGLPRAVRQADDVCTKDCVTEDTASTRIRFISNVFSSAPRELKMSLVASGAKKNKPTADGKATARVIKRDLKTFFFAPFISPLSASGEICGMLEAEKP